MLMQEYERNDDLLSGQILKDLQGVPTISSES